MQATDQLPTLLNVKQLTEFLGLRNTRAARHQLRIGGPLRGAVLKVGGHLRIDRGRLLELLNTPTTSDGS